MKVVKEMFMMKNIPQAIMTVVIDDEAYGIKSFTEDMFHFECIREMNSIKKIMISFFMLEEYQYIDVSINDFLVELCDQTEFSFVYKVAVFNNVDFKKNTNRLYELLKDAVDIYGSNLINYIMEKNKEHAENLYPKAKDNEISESYEVQKNEWFKDILYDKKDYRNGITNSYELAFEIDNFELYREFLITEKDEFFNRILEKNYLALHPLFKNDFNRIYIGNQYCHNLFPDSSMLCMLLDKAYKEGLHITLAFTYIRESFIDKHRQLIEFIFVWCIKKNKEVEIIVNDWGMFNLLEGKNLYLKASLGILLNKRKKDNRDKWKWGISKYDNNTHDNNLSIEGYRIFLTEELKIKRFEYDASHNKCRIHTRNNSMHFPYFQMNTSQYCPLYAQCVHFNRDRQELVTNCPQYCGEFVFMYPKHLFMIGKYNSNFGFNPQILMDKNIVNYYLNEGIDRFVLNVSI